MQCSSRETTVAYPLASNQMPGPAGARSGAVERPPQARNGRWRAPDGVATRAGRDTLGKSHQRGVHRSKRCRASRRAERVSRAGVSAGPKRCGRTRVNRGTDAKRVSDGKWLSDESGRCGCSSRETTDAYPMASNQMPGPAGARSGAVERPPQARNGRWRAPAVGGTRVAECGRGSGLVREL